MRTVYADGLYSGKPRAFTRSFGEAVAAGALPTAALRFYRLRSRRPFRDAGDDWDGSPGALPLAWFGCPGGTFWVVGFDRVVEREGVIKFLTVRDLDLGALKLPTVG